ncbi:MAG: ATP-binding protein [Bacteroidota bacterium]
MYINRLLIGQIRQRIGSPKALLIFGARQLGKTTLLKKLFEGNADVLWLNGDEPDTRAIFDGINSSRLRNLVAGHKLLVIDEAQRIQDIGVKIKLITDNIPEVQVVATGSSSFELANEVNEALTGRKWEFNLFPLAFEEMVNHHGILEEKRLLPIRLLFGYYPEIVTHPGEEKDYLRELTDSFLYKDILQWENIKKPDKLISLLQALAFQVGNQVSYNELGKLTGLDNKTVEKYIGLLEQVFVIFRLGSFSRNLRNELKSSRKIYFYDNGIRNALISAFQPINLRNDIGALWENWIISERQKYIHYHKIWTNTYFWRTTQQQEIDYLEERDGQIFAWEFKWKPIRKKKFPSTFLKKYTPHTQEVIHAENFEQFILNTESNFQ